MKITICFFLMNCLFCLVSVRAIAQDILTKTSGEDLAVKVLEVGTEEIKYKRFDNPDGPVYTIRKTEVMMLRYENGVAEIISNERISEAEKPTTKDNLYFKGQMDASLYYQNYKPAATGTLVTSLFSPVLGLVPAIACSSTAPKDHNLGFIEPDLIQDPQYYMGYSNKAKRIKSGKVWSNWGIGLGVNILLLLVFLPQ
jgi:hypothetical protein